MSSNRVTERMTSRLASLNHAPGKDVNFLENQVHTVMNPYHQDYQLESRDSQLQTSMAGQTYEWTLAKFYDCCKSGFFKVVFNAITPDLGTEAFINNAGYFIFQRMQIKLTNNDYTANFPLSYFFFDRQRLVYNSRQYLQFQETDMMIGRPLAYRQARLAAGHTFRIDVEVGQAIKGFENMFWLSPLSHNLQMTVQMASQPSDLVWTSTAGTASNADFSNWVNNIELYMDKFTVDDDARAGVIADYNTDDGLYNFVREPRMHYFSVAAAAATAGSVELKFKETRPAHMITIFYECADKVNTAWAKSPFDIQGPTMTDNGGNTVNFPTHFEIKAGEEVIIRKREVGAHLNFDHRTKFVDREAGDWILNIPFTCTDPLKDNTLYGVYDPNVWVDISVVLYYSGAVASGGTGARVAVMIYTNNFIHNSGGDANKVLS